MRVVCRESPGPIDQGIIEYSGVPRRIGVGVRKRFAYFTDEERRSR